MQEILIKSIGQTKHASNLLAYTIYKTQQSRSFINKKGSSKSKKYINKYLTMNPRQLKSKKLKISSEGSILSFPSIFQIFFSMF